MKKRSYAASALSLLLCGAIVAAGAKAQAAEGKDKEDKAVGGLGLSGTAPAAPAAEGELQLPATPEKGLVRLHVKTDNQQFQLKRNVATIMTSATTGVLIQEVICRAPCGAVVDGRLGEQFYFGGLNVIESDRFQLINYAGDVEATVKEGNHTMHSVGGSMLVIGILGAVVGGIFALTGDAKIGLIGAGAGTGLAVGGYLMYAGPGATTVDLHQLPAN